MSRTIQKWDITDPDLFVKKARFWSSNYREAVCLDSNKHCDTYHTYDVLVAVDAFTSMVTDAVDAFKKLHEYQKITQDWIFGYITYDIKNATEDLKSENQDGLAFPELFFFQPQKIISIKGNQVYFEYLNMCADEMGADFKEISEIIFEENILAIPHKIIQQRIDKATYLDKIRQIQEHIHRGDVYEINFCMEFFQSEWDMNPLAVFEALNQMSKAPFSVFLKNNTHYLLSASPERYLKKEGEKIISQPIKGTAKRSLNPLEDEQLKIDLAKDEKERSENIMITDLVRNDLSKTAQKGSVIVEELCRVYSYQQVHQMISTIVSRIDENLYNPVTVIEASFPMGSMTGAPKVSAMQLIEQFEETKRGLYSGTVGYFTPNGDFDFNVVIRSILYNAQNKYVSFSVGSAITALSVPEKEYDECLLKAKAMMEVLG